MARMREVGIMKYANGEAEKKLRNQVAILERELKLTRELRNTPGRHSTDLLLNESRRRAKLGQLYEELEQLTGRAPSREVKAQRDKQNAERAKWAEYQRFMQAVQAASMQSAKPREIDPDDPMTFYTDYFRRPGPEQMPVRKSGVRKVVDGASNTLGGITGLVGQIVDTAGIAHSVAKKTGRKEDALEIQREMGGAFLTFLGLGLSGKLGTALNIYDKTSTALSLGSNLLDTKGDPKKRLDAAYKDVTKAVGPSVIESFIGRIPGLVK